MLDVLDFVAEKGGDPKNVRESQRRRYAPEGAVDEVIALYEDHRKGKSSASLLTPSADRAALQQTTKLVK